MAVASVLSDINKYVSSFASNWTSNLLLPAESNNLNKSSPAEVALISNFLPGSVVPMPTLPSVPLIVIRYARVPFCVVLKCKLPVSCEISDKYKLPVAL